LARAHSGDAIGDNQAPETVAVAQVHLSSDRKGLMPSVSTDGREDIDEVLGKAVERSTFSTPGVHLEVEVFGHVEFEGQQPGPAKTNVNDRVKTVAADDAGAALDRPVLYELAKIDPDRYTIVGIDVRVDGPTTGIATVCVVDRLEQSIARQTDMTESGRSRVEIPVLQFTLPEPKVEDFITHTFDEILIKISEFRLAEQLAQRAHT
jgi:hypothetical protein